MKEVVLYICIYVYIYVYIYPLLSSPTPENACTGHIPHTTYRCPSHAHTLLTTSPREPWTLSHMGHRQPSLALALRKYYSHFNVCKKPWKAGILYRLAALVGMLRSQSQSRLSLSIGLELQFNSIARQNASHE
jgi:hypothetical protein